MTPVPLLLQETCYSRKRLLGNASFLPKHVGGVSSAVVTSTVGGRLQVFWQTWASIRASPRVVSILKNGYTLPFQTRPPLTWEPLLQSGYATSVRQNLLQESVWSLLAKQAIKRVHNPSSLGFYNRLFLVPKPDGGPFWISVL